MAADTTPRALRPFKRLGFHPKGNSGDNYYGECVFCGGSNKMYVSAKTGQWSCKSGTCAKSGNIYTFLTEWFKMQQEDQPRNIEDKLNQLAKERGIPATSLEEAGIVWDGKCWVIPVKNGKGTVVNARFYEPGTKLQGLPAIDLSIWNINDLLDPDKKDWRVYNCEGEWDGIALLELVTKSRERAVVVGVPGSGVFKQAWVNHYRGREVVNCYDSGEAGQKGNLRVQKMLRGVASSFKVIGWPSGAPDGFDVRDFVKAGGKLSELKKLITDPPELEAEPGESSPQEQPVGSTAEVFSDFPKLSSGKRNTFESVQAVYARHLEMTPDMLDALRVIYAVVMTNQIEGDPLWMHIAAPPGFGKTEMLMSCASAEQCITRSTLTPHLLVSGFLLPGGRDPSLIPKLLWRTFILKDFTEILEMPKANKDEIYSILRGAYDGRVEKSFGNGVNREYLGHFTMLSGVTPRIFAEQSAALGERFLIFYYGDDSEAIADRVVMAALRGVGSEETMRTQLSETAKSFLEFQIESSDIPAIPEPYLKRIMSLSQLVSMLRATVARDISRERVLYRPSYEMGTRLAKQLKKLLLGLALLNDPPEITEDDYRIVMRTAVSSCIGWNLDALRALAKKEGQSYHELAEEAKVPAATMRDQLEDLVLLGVLHKGYEPNPAGRGASVATYWLSDPVKKHWKGAGLPTDQSITKGLSKITRRRRSARK